ncbi:antirestriction protein ArdA [Pilimelia columellifera]|uniref:Antirestriction protein ArdA n=1 Tax=Pilimelia columellifera subsp. columellifera TaxID=706583 RepID=A0ABN3NIS2_9ACTN
MDEHDAAGEVPQVWVGCLGCYNDGGLAGEWFPASDAPTSMAAFNERVRCVGRYHLVDGHEEIWCLDHEHFDGVLDGEFAPSTGARVAALITDLTTGQRQALAAWIAHTDTAAAALTDEHVQRWRQEYVGRFDSEQTFAQHHAVDTHAEAMQAPPWPFGHIDWPAATLHLFSTDYWSHPAGGGAVDVFAEA